MNPFILQFDAEIIPLDHHTKEGHGQMSAVDSEAKLQQLVEHTNSSLHWLEPSVDELQRLVEDYTVDIHQIKEAHATVYGT